MITFPSTTTRAVRKLHIHTLAWEYSCNQSHNGLTFFVTITASKLNSLRPFNPVELNYFSDNKTIWRLGALEPKWTIITPPPPLAGIVTIISSNHGIIWKIEVPEKGTRYVAQVGTQSI